MADVRDKFKSKLDKGEERPEKASKGRRDNKATNKQGEDVEIGMIWKQGFPMATDEKEAISTAETTARNNGVTGELLGSPVIIATDAHVEAGEFLVCLIFGKNPEV